MGMGATTTAKRTTTRPDGYKLTWYERGGHLLWAVTAPTGEWIGMRESKRGAERLIEEHKG